MKMYFDYIQGRIAGPFFCGADLTVADLALHMLVNYFVNGEISFVSKNYVNGGPGINKNYAAVKAHPMVKAYHAAYATDSDAIDQV